MAKHIDRYISASDDEIDTNFERVKHVTLVLLALIISMTFVGYCFYIVVADVGSADNIKWATSVLTGTTGALLGYFIRRSQRGDEE